MQSCWCRHTSNQRETAIPAHMPHRTTSAHFPLRWYYGDLAHRHIFFWEINRSIQLFNTLQLSKEWNYSSKHQTLTSSTSRQDGCHFLTAVVLFFSFSWVHELSDSLPRTELHTFTPGRCLEQPVFYYWALHSSSGSFGVKCYVQTAGGSVSHSLSCILPQFSSFSTHSNLQNVLAYYEWGI